MDETSLRDKLRKIEALHAGATTDGERDAASAAAERIRERLLIERSRDRDVELQYSIPDPWERRLFLALCRRYGLEPFRYRRQRHSSLVLIAPEKFQHQTLWPEFVALARELTAHLSAVADRVIREAIHANVAEAPERQQGMLGASA